MARAKSSSKSASKSVSKSAQKFAGSTTETKRSGRRQMHEDRLNPENDQVPGHMGYTHANLRDVISEEPRVETKRVGTHENTAMVSSKSRRAGSRSEPQRSMEGRPNSGGRGSNRKRAAAAKGARAGAQTASAKSAGGPGRKSTAGRASTRR